tara:strand:- start:343 stop:1098 length:756 start_codon:yes stop_codon:yes gene_type:complete
MRFFILCLSILLLFSTESNAQSVDEKPLEIIMPPHHIKKWKISMERADGSYQQTLQEFNKSPEDLKNNILRLRGIYPRTSRYAPFAKQVIDKLVGYAYIVDTSKDSLELNTALDDYRTLLDYHITNLDVLDLAITMARINIQFGDEQYFQTIKDGITAYITKRGKNGLTPDSAYKVLTYGEETYLLALTGGTIKKSLLYDVNGRYFNVHDIELPDGSPTQIYVDVTTPIVNVFYTQKTMEKNAPLNTRQWQ